MTPAFPWEYSWCCCSAQSAMDEWRGNAGDCTAPPPCHFYSMLFVAPFGLVSVVLYGKVLCGKWFRTADTIDGSVAAALRRRTQSTHSCLHSKSSSWCNSAVVTEGRKGIDTAEANTPQGGDERQQVWQRERAILVKQYSRSLNLDVALPSFLSFFALLTTLQKVSLQSIDFYECNRGLFQHTLTVKAGFSLDPGNCLANCLPKNLTHFVSELSFTTLPVIYRRWRFVICNFFDNRITAPPKRPH